MPLFIIVVGIILIAAGLNDKLGELKRLLIEDFKPSDGTPGFQIWLVALIGIGAIGYYKPLKPFANAFLALVIMSIFLKKDGGLFDKLMQALKG